MFDYIIKSSFIRKRNTNYNVYIEYIDVDGKNKQKSLAKYKTKKEAEKHLIDLKSSINNNKFILPKDLTLVKRCYKYMEDNYNNASPNTSTSRTTFIEKDIVRFFNDTKLIDVTPTLLQRYINDLYERYTYESFKVRYGFVRAVLKESYRLREIQENPCDFVKLPNKKIEEANINVYDRDEVKELISKLEGNYIEIPILLMVSLGLRVGEALGLTWNDIDFNANTISINRIQVYTAKTGILYKSPKTQESIRTLTVPVELMNKLKKLKIERNKLILENVIDEKQKNLVCLNSNLKEFRESTLWKAFKKFRDRNNLRHIRLHDLRHTNATMMLLSGIEMKVVSERLGHTDIKISMNRYSHVLKEMDEAASHNLNDILFN